MREIQPVNILIKGIYVPANYFEVVSVYDNLSTQAEFEYSYISVTSNPIDIDSNIVEVLQRERIKMSGQDYIDWNNAPDINESAYTWVANKVNIVYI